jgi:PAS domain S-box-containing protein
MAQEKLGHLIVIDDETEILTPLHDLFSEWGYEVRGFTSGKEALAALKEKDCDLLLTDLVMPEMDGIEVIKAAIEIDPLLVCIIITGKGTIQTAVEAMKFGAFDYILKPMEWKILKPVLSRAMKVRRLRKSEEKYRSIVEDQTELICRWKPEEILTYVNEAYCRYFNKTPEELIGHSFMPFIPEEDREMLRQHFSSINRINPVSTHEHRVISPDGEICWQQWTNRALFDDQGHITEFQSVGHDITERKQTEDKLRQSEEKYHDLYDNAPDMYHTLDANGIIVDCNETEAKMLGYNREEIIGKPATDFFTEESKRLHEITFPQLKETKVLNLEREFIRKDGTTFPAIMNVFTEYDKKGKFVGTKIISTDISVLKQAERTLRDSEEKYRTLVNNALVGIYKTNLKGDFLFVNEALARIMEFDSPEEMMSESVPKRYKDPKDREVLIGKLRGNNNVENFEVDLLTKTGETRNIILSAALKGDTISGMIMDITERKKAEEALRESEGKLNAMLQSIADHMSMMDNNLNIIWANDIAKKIFGDDIVGKKCYEAYHKRKEPCEPYPCLTLKAFQDGKVHGHETQVMDKNGNIIYFHCTANVALKDKEGKPIAVIEISRDITERKKAEEMLRQSEERYRKQFEEAIDAIFLADLGTGIIVDCNIAASKLVEREKSEIIGKHQNFLHPAGDIKDGFSKTFKSHMTGESSELIEDRVITKSGQIKDVAIRASKITIEGKQVMQGMFRDTTDRKRAEEALRTSEAQLSNALKVARMGHWEYDVAKDLFTFNDYFYAIFRTTAEEIGGYTMSSAEYANRFCHPDDVSVVSVEIRKAIETTDPNYSRQLEHRIIYADGETGYIAVRFFIVKDDKGRTVKTYGANQDITERKKAEKALKESRNRLLSIFRTAPVGIGVVSSPDRIIMDVNDQICTMLGYYESQLLGKSKKILYKTVKEFNHVVTKLNKQIDEYGIGTVETKWKRKNGRIVDVILRSSPIDCADLSKGITFTALDITEQKQIKEKLEISHRQLRALASRISEVEETEKRRLAHELHDQVGQNLTALGINLNTLPTFVSSGEAEKIKDCITDTQKILNETTQSIRSVMADLRPSVLDDYGLVAAVRWYSQRFFERTGILVKITGEDLQPRLSGLLETTLYRITQEALTNVSKHAGANKININISEAKGNVTLAITDDGKGFKPATVYKKKKKTVWGLLTMRERAEAMGGKFDVQSSLGKGTTIIVEIKR